MQGDHTAASDRLGGLRIALEDLTPRCRASSPRSTRCASARIGTGRCSLGGNDAKQLADLQHELETLQRRQASLEDSLLEVMERREELQTQQD